MSDDIADALARAKSELMAVHDALHAECDGNADLPGEIRALRQREGRALATAISERNRADALALRVADLEAKLEMAVAALNDAKANFRR